MWIIRYDIDYEIGIWCCIEDYLLLLKRHLLWDIGWFTKLNLLCDWWCKYNICRWFNSYPRFIIDLMYNISLYNSHTFLFCTPCTISPSLIIIQTPNSHNQPELLYDINTSNIENTTRQHDEAIQLQQLDHTSHHKFHTAVDRQYRWQLLITSPYPSTPKTSISNTYDLSSISTNTSFCTIFTLYFCLWVPLIASCAVSWSCD